MASFVEQATLKVNDQSSAQIRKINAELKKLFATAKSLKSMKANININDRELQRRRQPQTAIGGFARAKTIALNIKANDRGLKQATTNVKQLSAALRRLKTTTVNIKANDRGLKQATTNVKQLSAALRGLKTTAVNIKVNDSGLTKARRQIAALRSAARSPINVKVSSSGAPRLLPARHRVRHASRERRPPRRRMLRRSRGVDAVGRRAVRSLPGLFPAAASPALAV